MYLNRLAMMSSAIPPSSRCRIFSLDISGITGRDLKKELEMDDAGKDLSRILLIISGHTTTYGRL